MKYYANIINSGHNKWGPILGPIDLHDAPTNPSPIGRAICFRWDGAGLGVWKLIIDGVAIPGEWVIIDREFRPAQQKAGRE
jgi:hypothetical protein